LGIALIQFNNRGFTFVELIVVVAIYALMLVVALPKLVSFWGNERKESVIFKAYIEAVADNSFVNGKTNYLSINLSKEGDKTKDSKFSDNQYNVVNAVVVYDFIDGKFIQNKSNLLKARNFSSSFVLSEVILDGDRTITSGNVLIPFYSDGSGESFKVKVLSGNSTAIFLKNKNSKTVQLVNGIQKSDMQRIFEYV